MRGAYGVRGAWCEGRVVWLQCLCPVPALGSSRRDKEGCLSRDCGACFRHRGCLSGACTSRFGSLGHSCLKLMHSQSLVHHVRAFGLWEGGACWCVLRSAVTYGPVHLSATHSTACLLCRHTPAPSAVCLLLTWPCVCQVPAPLFAACLLRTLHMLALAACLPPTQLPSCPALAVQSPLSHLALYTCASLRSAGLLRARLRLPPPLPPSHRADLEAQLRDSHAQHAQQVQQAQEEGSRQQAEARRLQEELQAVQADARRLREELQAAQAELDAERQAGRRLQEELQAAQGQLDAAGGEARQLQEALEAAQAREAADKEALGAAQAREAADKDALQAAQAREAADKDALQAAKVREEEGRGTLQAAEEEAQRLRDALQRKVEEGAEARRAQQQAEQALREAKVCL